MLAMDDHIARLVLDAIEFDRRQLDVTAPAGTLLEPSDGDATKPPPQRLVLIDDRWFELGDHAGAPFCQRLELGVDLGFGDGQLIGDVLGLRVTLTLRPLAV